MYLIYFRPRKQQADLELQWLYLLNTQKMAFHKLINIFMGLSSPTEHLQTEIHKTHWQLSWPVCRTEAGKLGRLKLNQTFKSIKDN